MRQLIALLSLTAALLAVGCSDDNRAGETEAPDVENSYTPPTGKQVARIVCEADWGTKIYTIKYDADGRVKTIDTVDELPDRTTTNKYSYAYKEDHIEVNKDFRCYLDDEGRVESIVSGNRTSTFEYDEAGYLKQSVNSNDWIDNMHWTAGNLTGNTSISSVTVFYSRSFTEIPNRTNLELTALITNAYWIFENMITNANPLFSTFGIFGKRCANLPARDIYNQSDMQYTYEFDEDDCPVKISTGYCVFTIEYN